MITKKHIIDYLQCDISSFGFQDLYNLVISKKNIKFYIKNGGDKYTLIEKKEICNKCKAEIEDYDYIYRRKAPNVRAYKCSKCGYFEVYIEE